MNQCVLQIGTKTINLHYHVGNLNFQPNEVLSDDLLFWLPFPKDWLRRLIEVLLEKSTPLSRAITIERLRLLNQQILQNWKQFPSEYEKIVK